MKKFLIAAGVVMGILLEYIYLICVEVGRAVIELKLSLTTEIIMERMKETALHPFHKIAEYFTDKNWFYIIGAAVILIGIIFITVKRVKELDKEWESSDEGTHGTAKWGSFKSLIKDGNFKSKTQKQLFNEWKETLR